MRKALLNTHNICFHAELRKNIYLIPTLIWSYGHLTDEVILMSDLEFFQNCKGKHALGKAVSETEDLDKTFSLMYRYI